MPAVAAKSSYATELAQAEGSEFVEVLAFGVEHGWFDVIIAAVKRDPQIAQMAIRDLPQRDRAALFAWAATEDVPGRDAGEVATAALVVDDLPAATRIITDHPDAWYAECLIDALSDHIAHHRGRAIAVECCRAGCSPFPLAIAGLDEGYAAAQRAWIEALLAEQSPTIESCRRRLLLITQAAEEAGLWPNESGEGHRLDAIDPSPNRRATAPHMTGMLPDVEPLAWLAREAVRHGTVERDEAFGVELRQVAAAHAALTGNLTVLAAMGAANTDTNPT